MWRNDIKCKYMFLFSLKNSARKRLTHWGRAAHICVSKLTITVSDNGLSPDRRQAIIWTNAGILLIRTLGTNFSEILGVVHSFSFSKMHLKMSSAKWRLFGIGLNELKQFLLHSSSSVSSLLSAQSATPSHLYAAGIHLPSPQRYWSDRHSGKEITYMYIYILSTVAKVGYLPWWDIIIIPHTVAAHSLFSGTMEIWAILL